jgi:hypothetical protein
MVISRNEKRNKEPIEHSQRGFFSDQDQGKNRISQQSHIWGLQTFPTE